MLEPTMTMTCHYPDVLKALLLVMPSQIDAPIDSDAAGVIMEFITRTVKHRGSARGYKVLAKQPC
jgi:hypothetical protein